MFSLDLIFLIIGILAILGELIFPSFFIYLWFTNRYYKLPFFYPKICVIIPCKGIEKNLQENLLAICNQDYPNFNVIFVLDSKDDLAYPVVSKVLQSVNNAKVEFSEILKECSGKISALISGIKKAGEIEVYVFADSDIKPNKDWLKNLVSPLNNEKIAATTGFRWYFYHNLKSSLISVWNMASMTSLFHPISNYAWGGSTAIKKTLFEKLKIEEKWKKGFSDDLILTSVVKDAGYQIRFIPRCIVESPFDLTIRKFVKWSVQQVTWVRWYNPLIWYFSLFGLICLKISTVLGFFLVYFGFTFPGLLMISTIFIELIYGLISVLVIRKFIPYPKKEFGSIIPYIFLMPFVFFLLIYIMILSCFKKEIKWAGRTYKKSDVVSFS